MREPTLQERRRAAIKHIRRMSVKRRALLARWLDEAVQECTWTTGDREITLYPGMTMAESKEVHEILKDIRQFCETPTEGRANS